MGSKSFSKVLRQLDCKISGFLYMLNQWILSGKYNCTIDLLFDWFGISCMTTDNFCFYLQNRLIQTSQTGGQKYSDTSPFSIPWRGFLYMLNLSGQNCMDVRFYSLRCILECTISSHAIDIFTKRKQHQLFKLHFYQSKLHYAIEENCGYLRQVCCTKARA